MVFVLHQMNWYWFFQLWLLIILPIEKQHSGKTPSPAAAVFESGLASFSENDCNDIDPILRNDFIPFLRNQIFENDTNDRYHRVPALSGDNIFALLKRYHLHEHQCNFDRFYELNDLNKESRLYAGKDYYIPVLIYKYNGKSIRSTIGIDTWEQALRIKRYNEELLREGLRKSTLTASNILWVCYHELHCLDGQGVISNNNTTLSASDPGKERNVNNEATTVSNINVAPEPKTKPDFDPEEFKLDPEVIKKLEGSGGLRKYPIFGAENAYVELLDNSLRGKVYYIVSGHGGPDPGAIGNQNGHTLCEDEYAYDVSLRLTRQLLQRGALVYMIIRDPNDGIRSGKYLAMDNDEYCYGNYRIPTSQKKRLFQRSDAVNTLFEKHKAQGIKEQYCIVIHIDSRSKSENTDVFFYYFPDSMEGRALAHNMHKTFKQKYGIHRRDGSYHGTVTPRDLHMLREPKPVSVFIELGNIRNKSDQRRFVEETNREALAKWMYEGLIRK